MRDRRACRGAGLSRRAVMGGLAAAPLAGLAGAARGQSAPIGLPLRATLLEHVGTVVPDVTAAAVFHSRVFNPAIFTEDAPPLRYYVDVNGGYIAFGARPGVDRGFVDHICALVEDYDPDAMAARLREDGIPIAPNLDFALFGLFSDPDGLGVQLVADPGGWFPTVIPAEPLIEGPALVAPAGLSHAVLHVAELERSLEFYRRYFGSEAGREDGTVWFAMGDTRLGLRAAGEGEAPAIDHVSVRVAPFDPDRVIAALRALGAEIGRPADPAPGVVRFTDPAGLVLELKPV